MSEINEQETEEQRRARAAALDQEIRDQRLMSFIDEKFEQMKEENEGLRRKVKKQEEKQFKFDKKAHEVQFLFNTELRTFTCSRSSRSNEQAKTSQQV